MVIGREPEDVAAESILRPAAVGPWLVMNHGQLIGIVGKSPFADVVLAADQNRGGFDC